MSTKDRGQSTTAIGAAAALVVAAMSLPVLTPVLKKWSTKADLKREFASEASSEATMSVSGLFIHPVKSLRAVSVTETALDDKGLVGDRRLMVVYPAPLPAWKDQWDVEKDTTHRFLTQRQCPSLARVKATFSGENAQALLLSYGNKTLEVPLAHGGTVKEKRSSYRAGIWDDQVLVEDLGDEAASLFQDIVNADENSSVEATGSTQYQTGIRLVMHTVDDRKTDPKFTPATATTTTVKSIASWFISGMGINSSSVRPAELPPVSLTDGFPVLIACEKSLNEVNRRLKEKGKETIPMSRFRPNIVIKGTQEPFEEDYWKYIAIGNQLFAVVKACPRCKQSCTDQETGKVTSEPVNIMKDFRALDDQDPSGQDVFFAQNAIPLGPIALLDGSNVTGNSLQVGDVVRVLQKGDPVFR